MSTEPVVGVAFAMRIVRVWAQNDRCNCASHGTGFCVTYPTNYLNSQNSSLSFIDLIFQNLGCFINKSMDFVLIKLQDASKIDLIVVDHLRYH